MKVRTIMLVILVAAGSLQAQTGERWRRYLENDYQRFLSEMNFETLLISSGWLAAMYGLSFYDEDINQSVKTLYRGPLAHYFSTIDQLGNAPYTIPVSIAVLGLTLTGNDKKFQDAAFTSTEALLVTALATGILKRIFGRGRPDDGYGSHSFRWFSGYDSFPSGHSSSAFALLIPWISYYPSPWTYALLIFPASTAVARMILNRHWFTDVLTGSALGIIIGASLARWHKDLAEREQFYPAGNQPKVLLSLRIPL